MAFVRVLGRLFFHLVASLVVALVVGMLVKFIIPYEADGFSWGGMASLLSFIGYWIWRFVQWASASRYDTGAPPVGHPPDIPRSRDKSALDLIPLTELQISVVTSALLANEAINNEWGNVAGEEPMSIKSNLIVRMEMLWFFLHVVNRFAFKIGGPQARAFIQDSIAQNVVRDVVTSSFDTSHTEEGFDTEQWQQNMISDAIEGLNETELDYGSRRELFGESDAASFSETRAVGRLGKRIAESVGHEENWVLRLKVSTTAMQAFAKSGLVVQVANACRVLEADEIQPSSCPGCGVRPNPADQPFCDDCTTSRMHQH